MKKSQIRQRLVMKMLDTSHIEQFNELLRYAFQVTDSDLLFTGWSDDSIKRSKYPILQHAKVLGWFDKGQDSRRDSKNSQNNIESNLQDSKQNLDFTESRFYTNNEFTNLDSKEITESINKDSIKLANLESKTQNLDSKNKSQLEDSKLISQAVNNRVRSTQPLSRPLRGAKNREEGDSSVAADFSQEADKRGSPPLSKKSGCFFTQRGSGEGILRFFAQESPINQPTLHDIQQKGFESTNQDSKQNLESKNLQITESRFYQTNEFSNLDSKDSIKNENTESNLQDSKQITESRFYQTNEFTNLDSKKLTESPNDKLVSQIALYPMKMNIYNQIYAMGGITGVATYPEYSGIGLMADLMKEILKIMRDSRQSIACLYPYSIPYYRSRGFEIVSDKMTFSIKDNQFPKPPAVNGMMQRVCENHPDLIALHNEFASKTHGCLVRDSLAWNEYWRWDVEDTIVAIYYDESDKPTGYIVYLLENDIFKIKEMIYLNEEARHGLWGYIEAHKSMFERIEGANYSNHSLAFLLEDGHIKESISPYIMARIVDVTQFLERYPFDSVESSFSLCLVVSDPLLEWNNMAFVLHFSAQGFKVEMVEKGFIESYLRNVDSIESAFDKSQKLDSMESNSLHCDAKSFGSTHSSRNAEPQANHLNFDKSQNLDSIKSAEIIKLDIQTLSAMLLGYKRPLYLRSIGRLEASDNAINKLEEILPEGKAYFSDYF